MTHQINHVFYDYIFIGPALLGEFRGFNLRNDKPFVVYIAFPLINGVVITANGQLNRKIKVVREPKS